MLVVSNLLLGASGAALASEDVMNDVYSNEHLHLLQLSARRNQQHVEMNASYVPENSQGPYQVLGFNTECPDDQILTLRQCSEAAWDKTVVAAVVRISPPFFYHGVNNGNGPPGCYYVPNSNGGLVYYNPQMSWERRPRQWKSICGVNGGRVAQKPEEAALPPGGVEHLAANTECGECGLLSLDECKLAGEALGLHLQGNGYPLVFTRINPRLPRKPLGCWSRHSSSQGHRGLIQWNMDTEDDGYGHGPDPIARPICGVCPTTTTTTPAPPPPPDDSNDVAEAVGDPHITTNGGKHFDMQD
jgi:hypothetical protein